MEQTMVLGTDKVSGAFLRLVTNRACQSFHSVCLILMKGRVKLISVSVFTGSVLVPFGTCNWPLIGSDIPASSWEN